MTQGEGAPTYLEQLGDGFRTGEAMAEHTTFRVGGPAEYFFEATSIDEVKRVAALCREHDLPLTVIGKGSNLLVSDRGIPGMVMVLGDRFSDHGFLTEAPDPAQADGTGYRPDLTTDRPEALDEAPEGEVYYLYAQAGMSFIDCSDLATELGLTGLEFACGIPGSVGGAIYMNAGAYGGSIEDCVVTVHALNPEGEEILVSGDAQHYRYRGSKFQDDGDIVLGAIFRLTKGDADKVTAAVEDFTRRRTASQPLEMPSAGSIFKRPVGYYAGKLISDCKLRGTTIGGAQVSTKHAGFIVNTGQATADDVHKLIRHIKDAVLDRYAVPMETEVRFMGDWTEEELAVTRLQELPEEEADRGPETAKYEGNDTPRDTQKNESPAT